MRLITGIMHDLSLGTNPAVMGVINIINQWQGEEELLLCDRMDDQQKA
jgi:hypothetical protein